MTKGAKTSVSRRPQTRMRRGIAKRGGWVDQRVAEILKSPLPFAEKTRLVYELLAAEPPIPGNHLAPMEVIRVRLSRMFPRLASAPDGPLTPWNMPGTIYLVLERVIQKWSPVKASRKRGGGASFITYLTNYLVWTCQRHLEQTRDRFREIPLSELLLLGDWDDQDGIDEDYVPDLGFAPALEELL
jgi:hypothetical protein